MENRKEKNRKSALRKRKKIRRRLFGVVIVLIILVIGSVIYNIQFNQDEVVQQEQTEVKQDEVVEEQIKPQEAARDSIILSFAGDCTLGTDTTFNVQGSFNQEVKQHNNDYAYFMRNVVPIFKQDDYTLVNLETTLTNATVKANKEGKVVYHFKGNKEYAKILSLGSIEGVTIDNNHIGDYSSQGLSDTINTLKENKIDYCGRGNRIIKEIKGIKIGFLGYSSYGITNQLKQNIINDIRELRQGGVDLIIPYFHWGSENQSTPNSDQVQIARFSIDNGADLVIGSHPHVIQSIEKYNNKLIIYSMGNFCFGGNSNPTDKTTFIFQSKINLVDTKIQKIEYKVIPTYISSVQTRNDYVPTLATGNGINEILTKINQLSPTLNGSIKSEFFSIEDK